MRTYFQVTPYHLSLVIEGPDAPVRMDCTLFQVRHKLQMPNPSG